MYGDMGGGWVGDVLVLAFLVGDEMMDGRGWKVFCWGELCGCGWA